MSLMPRVAAHGFHFLRLLTKVCDGVHRAGGVADGALGVLAGLHRFDGDAQVAHVVHGVEDAEHVDAVLRALATKSRTTSLSSGGSPAGSGRAAASAAGCWAAPRAVAQPLPRVFLQKAQAGIERRTAPGLQRPVADLSSLAQIGSMSSVRMRVAISDWWASRRIISVT